MPPDVVQPDAESGVIAQMLKGVPLPLRLDPSALEAEGELTNRYELGRAVAGAVACGWSQAGMRRLAPATPPRRQRR